VQKEINQTWSFNASPQEVWDYLTKPELLEQWMGSTNFQPIIGHQFQLNGKGGCVNFCQVLEIIPCKKLSYSWRVKNASGVITVDSKVLWTLSEKAGETELKLVHDGFTTLEDHQAHNNGWTTLGNRLTALLHPIKI
jgi:uncharacterized protein YndB with AHSA1/START domain